MKDNIRISIVTPSYNQGSFLEETISSVLEQNYPNLEYIVIDGGSTDESVAIIRKYAKHLAYWVSEADNGQSHAINKGFRKSTGELVNWLNSDDLLEPGALNTLADAVRAVPGMDIFYGDYKAIDAYSNTIYRRKAGPFHRPCLYWGRQLSSQPAVFFKRSLLEKHGWIDEDNHFCMDTEFWIRCAMNGATFHQIKRIIGLTRVHQDTKTAKFQKQMNDTHKSLLRTYGSLTFLPRESRAETLAFVSGNRFWRGVSALRRSIYRGDCSWGRASKALKDLRPTTK